MEWIAEFGVEILDGKVKMLEMESEWKMGKTLERLETLEKWKVGMENGLQILVHNTCVVLVNMLHLQLF